MIYVGFTLAFTRSVVCHTDSYVFNPGHTGTGRDRMEYCEFLGLLGWRDNKQLMEAMTAYANCPIPKKVGMNSIRCALKAKT